MPDCSSGMYRRHKRKVLYSQIAKLTAQFVLAAILIWFSAYFGDRYHVRGPVIIINCLIALIGLPIMSFAKSNGVRYFGVFLLTAGSNANVPTSLAYQANNIRGQWTRAFSSALFVGFAGMGGISGGTIFRSQDKPKYVPGVSAAIAPCLLESKVDGTLQVSVSQSVHRSFFGEPAIETGKNNLADGYNPSPILLQMLWALTG
ncbi:MAG: hypothetical protein LQ350_008092 [Teloschistes chrysophthalmus]|nr:MAG: hypothetical protein LQ350_008092 [Niorma chrysophthalma]